MQELPSRGSSGLFLQRPLLLPILPPEESSHVWFYVLPEIDVKKLESLFRHKVLKLLLKEKRISEEWVKKLVSWRNSGFNIHHQVKIRSDDNRGRESLAQYILRSPFSQEKMTYREETKTVLYRTKIKPGTKKNFAVFPVLDWIATLTAHIPNKGEQLVRYIKKILQHLGLWEESLRLRSGQSHAPPGRSQKEKKEITFDPSYSQLV